MMESLFGPTLVNKDESVSTATLAEDGKIVAIYFSAHWCPPCRGFTPTLAEFYNKVKATTNGSKFEIVFVSSDRDEKSFKEYFAEMPWMALPFEQRETKQKLSSKFKVSGIPSLLFLDATTGEVVNKNGREIVMGDPEGEKFPWLPKTFEQIINENEGKLIDKSGADIGFEEATAGKIKGLYFSAHWCPPCRGFTPTLVKAYEAVIKAGKEFEIIFCSGDHDEKQFQEYLNEMPWKALPFQDSRESELSALFEVSGIPHLAILDENNKIITNNGRSAISSDPEGAEFPWFTKPIEELGESNAQTINDFTCFVAFTDGSEDKKTHVKTIMSPAAETEHAKGVEKKEIFFFWGGEDDICSSIRDFCNLEDDPENLLILLNIPGQSIYVCDQPLEAVTAETIGQILADHKAGSLLMRNIR